MMTEDGTGLCCSSLAIQSAGCVTHTVPNHSLTVSKTICSQIFRQIFSFLSAPLPLIWGRLSVMGLSRRIKCGKQAARHLISGSKSRESKHPVTERIFLSFSYLLESRRLSGPFDSGSHWTGPCRSRFCSPSSCMSRATREKSN